MIHQILGAVMLVYLGVAILFLMAELWHSPRLQHAASCFSGPDWAPIPRPCWGGGWDLTSWR